MFTFVTNEFFHVYVCKHSSFLPIDICVHVFRFTFVSGFPFVNNNQFTNVYSTNNQ